MYARQFSRLFRIAPFIALAVTLLSGYTALAQFECSTLESIGYNLLYDNERVWYDKNCKLKPKAKAKVRSYRPPILTCPYLPPRVEVFGHVVGTQCQMVDAAGVGRMDLIQRGFIDAVDIWSYVNGGIEVCFRKDGSLVFLDAAYAPRMAIELDSFERDGMTCGAIDRAGTVALLGSAAPATQQAAMGLPLFETIPLNDCLIKLQETLFLRAAPAGEIIGLVWLYSEVPAFEIKGYWYKIEFEGKTGYVSRYHRKVLRGGCG